MSEKLDKDQQIKSLGDAVEAYTLTIRNLREKVKSLESELKEYKRCAVVGGDGAKFGIDSEMWGVDCGVRLVVGKVVTVFRNKPGDLMATIQVDHEQTPNPRNLVTLETVEFYSTPDAVPGGDT